MNVVVMCVCVVGYVGDDAVVAGMHVHVWYIPWHAVLMWLVWRVWSLLLCSLRRQWGLAQAC